MAEIYVVFWQDKNSTGRCTLKDAFFIKADSGEDAEAKVKKIENLDDTSWLVSISLSEVIHSLNEYDFYSYTWYYSYIEED